MRMNEWRKEGGREKREEPEEGRRGVQRCEWMGMDWGRTHGWGIWSVGHQDGKGC